MKRVTTSQWRSWHISKKVKPETLCNLRIPKENITLNWRKSQLPIWLEELPVCQTCQEQEYLIMPKVMKK